MKSNPPARAKGAPSLVAVNNYHYRRGGAEVVFLEHMRLLEEAGWRVAPFSMHHPNNLPSEWSRFFADEIEFGGDYPLFEKLKMAGRVIYSMQARSRLRKLLDEFRPDVVHAHNIYHHLSPSILPVVKSYGIPLFLTLHDLKLACPSYKMLTHDGLCERCKGGGIHNVVVHRCVKNSRVVSSVVLAETAVNKLLGSYRRNVSRMIVPSRFLLEKMVEWGWERERFAWIPNFIEANEFDPSQPIGSEFLFLGRLSFEKGVKTLVKAAVLADVPLAIVGAGPQDEELRRLVSESKAKVRFLGYLSGNALREAVAKCRALILPSEVYENAPLSILEAYASGRPVIGARIGGIPELIREDRTGVTFRAADAEDLATALRKFVAMEDSRLRDMGREGREWVEKSFTRQFHLDLLLAEYRSFGVKC